MTNPYEYLTPEAEAEVRAVVAKGKERAKNGETNRPLTAEQYAAYKANRVEAALDEQAMAQWEARGFVSGNPHDRLEIPGNDEPDVGVDWTAACEHDISGIHRPAGSTRPCDAVTPEVGDVWLQPAPARRDPDGPVRRDTRKGMYLPRGSWGATEDALEAMMSETPHATQEGGGLTGVEDDYYRARAAMTRPPHEGPLTVEGAE